MKLLRVGEPGKEIPAILDNENKIRDLSKIIRDFNPGNLNFENLDKIKKVDIKSLAQLDHNQHMVLITDLLLVVLLENMVFYRRQKC